VTTLVTGARGGFGRIFSAALRSGGEDVVLTDRGASSDDGCLGCDLTDAGAVADLVRTVRPRTVFHLAGSFSNELETDYAANVMAARHLLEGLRQHQVHARVVVMGSAAEYGLLDPADNPVREDHVLRPVSVYGLTKAFQTQLALQHAYAHGSDVVVARMFNLLAPGLSDRLFPGRVERMIEDYRSGRTAVIEVGNLEAKRDYATAAEAIEQITDIAARGTPAGIYHVASGRAISMRELLHRMLDEVGVPHAAVREGVPHAGGRTGYDVPVIYADMTRTRALRAAAP
jgi:nucleoside-diphosphate-sugar epimerase